MFICTNLGIEGCDKIEQTIEHLFELFMETQ